MIKITRPDAPTFLTDIEGKWVKETEKAILYYIAETPTTPFKFKMYNDRRVKDALIKVFGTKCVYCESDYATVFDGDIEHFRPKGKVKEKEKDTPGYYWLANDWDNLFLACQHCNQNRKHKVYGEDVLRTMGKLDQFPLRNENTRLKDYADYVSDKWLIEESNRLLINPCLDDPSKHFEYDNKEALILPKTKKGAKSIEIFVLQRLSLVQARKKELLKLFRQIERVKRELERYNIKKNKYQKQILNNEIDELMSFTNQNAQYAGMSRYFVKIFLKDNKLI